MTDTQTPLRKDTPQNSSVHQPLTDVEKHMVDVFLTCHSPKQVSEAIGRSSSWVHNRLKKDYIKHEIELRQQDSANRADITNEWILNEIKETALAAKKDASWGAALNGFKMLGEINGLFDESKNNGITYNVMGSVVLAPNPEAAQKLLDNPNNPIDGDYEILDFNIGEDVTT